MRKLTKDEVIEKLYLHNKNIEIIGDYINIKEKTTFRCKICNNVFLNSVYDILISIRKDGCRKCQKRAKNKKDKSRTKPKEKYLSEVYNIWKDSIKIIGEYIGGNKKIETMCNKCGLIWYPISSSIIRGHGCPICGHKKTMESVIKKHDEFVDEIFDIYGNHVKILGLYKNGSTPIEVKCNICNNEWSPFAQCLIRRGCPKCNFSKGELLIERILKELNINFKTQYVIPGLKTTKNGTPRFDFVIFDNLKIIKIIEYDGYQHFIPVSVFGGQKRFSQQQDVDKFKDLYCNENKIQIIRINYKQLKNINSELIKNLIS